MRRALERATVLPVQWQAGHGHDPAEEGSGERDAIGEGEREGRAQPGHVHAMTPALGGEADAPQDLDLRPPAGAQRAPVPGKTALVRGTLQELAIGRIEEALAAEGEVVIDVTQRSGKRRTSWAATRDVEALRIEANRDLRAASCRLRVDDREDGIEVGRGGWGRCHGRRAGGPHYSGAVLRTRRLARRAEGSRVRIAANQPSVEFPRPASMAQPFPMRADLWRNCWTFRGFIAASVKRDFSSRYLGTQLGWLWAIAQPLALILIYTLVFAEIMKPALPGHDSKFAYSIYLCAGILLWQLFSDLVGRSVGVFVQNASLLKKVSVPKLSLPIIVALSGLSTFGVVAALFLGFLAIISALPGMALFAMIPVLVLVVALAMGLGIFLGSINVFYRDVEQSTGIVLQFWFWLTPIVYPVRAVPDFLETALAWNPLAPIVGFSQTLFLDGVVPDWMPLLYPTVVAAILLALGFAAFARLGGEMVDEL